MKKLLSIMLIIISSAVSSVINAQDTKSTYPNDPLKLKSIVTLESFINPNKSKIENVLKNYGVKDLTHISPRHSGLHFTIKEENINSKCSVGSVVVQGTYGSNNDLISLTFSFIRFNREEPYWWFITEMEYDRLTLNQIEYPMPKELDQAMKEVFAASMRAKSLWIFCPKDAK